jgi:hypothetical protein
MHEHENDYGYRVVIEPSHGETPSPPIPEWMLFQAAGRRTVTRERHVVWQWASSISPRRTTSRIVPVPVDTVQQAPLVESYDSRLPPSAGGP